MKIVTNVAAIAKVTFLPFPTSGKPFTVASIVRSKFLGTIVAVSPKGVIYTTQLSSSNNKDVVRSNDVARIRETLNQCVVLNVFTKEDLDLFNKEVEAGRERIDTELLVNSFQSTAFELGVELTKKQQAVLVHKMQLLRLAESQPVKVKAEAKPAGLVTTVPSLHQA